MTKEKESKKEPTEIQRTAANLAPGTPFRFARRFMDDMERLFEDFQGFRLGSLYGREFFPFTKEFEHVDWVPKIEVFEQNGVFTARADLPGLKKEDVKVELTNEALTLSGERKEEKEEKREGFYRSERSYGSFYRYIPLPEGAKTDNATAEFHDGVLEVKVQVPKSETRSRRLEITEGKKAASAKAGA
jgi:HSP20 family protein